MKRIILIVLAIVFLAAPCLAKDVSMLFIADANQATIDGQTVTYFELHVGATLYRIGKVPLSPELAEQYNYYQMQGHSLAKEGNTFLLDVLMPEQYSAKASEADEFAGWSYSDLLGRVMKGDIPVSVLKAFLQVKYTVDEGGEELTVKEDTFANWEADTDATKVWVQSYIPFVHWLGRKFE